MSELLVCLFVVVSYGLKGAKVSKWPDCPTYAQTLDYRSGVLEKTIISVQLVPLLLKDRGFLKNKVKKMD